MLLAIRLLVTSLVLVATASFSTAQDTSSNFTQQCESFGRALSLPNVTVNIAEFVPNGTNLTFPDNNVTCSRPAQLIYGGPICRIAMQVATSNASRITLEAWLPSNTSWNGRFLSTGNGGIGGCIQYEDIAYANSYGFAAVGANNGHNGTGGTAFAESSGVVEDFAYRSVRTGTVVGKQITNQFYGRQFSRSYYLGCSTGGRQGMKMAQDFPDEFDGIVAGAPAFDFNDLTSWSGHLTQLAGFDNTSSTFITPQHWSLIHASILAQCDALDGARDGIIEDPDLCRPTFTSLLCSANATNTSTCLNAGQVRRVNGILSPFYGENGTLIYPRLQPGAEVAAYGLYFSGQPFPYTTDWFRYAVLKNPNWNPRTQSLQDAAYANQLDLFGISTWNGNLSAFRDRGSKMLTYHGMQDQVISSDNSARYYNHLSETMSLPSSDLDSFYRYFRISGMGHCRGGPGASDIGQSYTGRRSTSQSNVLLAIMNWVENGTAPEYIQGYSSAANGPVYSRKHCKYPARNAHVGPGNYTDENTWRCVTNAADGLTMQ